MQDKKYYYLKLNENFFDSETVRVIESQRNGDTYTLILLKMYLKALKNDGKLILNEYTPYTPELLAAAIGCKLEMLKKALTLFTRLHLIEQLPNGTIYMVDIQQFIGSISDESMRKAKYREKIKTEKENGTNAGQMRDGNGTSTGQCPDIISYSISNSKSVSTSNSKSTCKTDIQENNSVSDTNSNTSKYTDSNSVDAEIVTVNPDAVQVLPPEEKKKFSKPTREEVQAYCEQQGYTNVDADVFIDYYTSNGWRVGKNPMKDWKACVRRWEQSEYGKKTSKGSNSFLNLWLKKKKSGEFETDTDIEDDVADVLKDW